MLLHHTPRIPPCPTPKSLPPRYERVGPRHSWTAGHLFTNASVFRLQRHADHHEYARKPYQVGCSGRGFWGVAFCVVFFWEGAGGK